MEASGALRIVFAGFFAGVSVLVAFVVFFMAKCATGMRPRLVASAFKKSK
jgi:hypothetical protein